MIPIKHFKIKNKLITIILSTTLLILTVAFTGIVIFTKILLQNSFLKETSTICRVLANNMVSIMIFGDSKEGRDTLRELHEGHLPSIKDVWVYYEDGGLFVDFHQPDSELKDLHQNDYELEKALPKLHNLPTAEFKGKYLHYSQYIYHKKKNYGKLYVRISVEELDNKIRDLIITMGLILLLLLPLSLILATKLQSIISKPILNLVDVNRQVSNEGNYTIRVKKAYNDEIGMLYDSFNDMMEQIHHRDIQRDQAEYELKAAEFFLSSVMESMPSALVTIDLDGVISQWNKSTVQLMGIDADEAQGKVIWKILPGLSKYKPTITQVFHTKRTVQFYKELIKIKGNTLYLNVTIFPLLASQSPQFVLMINNMTDIELKEQQLRQSQKMETVGTLAGGLAHDFNNVLGGIIGTISLFKYKLSRGREITPKDVEKYFNTIEDSANRASDMVQHLLSLTRKQELSFAPVDLNDILKSTVKICKNTFDKCIDIKERYFKTNAMASADSTQIEQCLLNLCINAAHAMTIMRNENEKYGGTLNIAIEHIQADKHFAKSHSESQEGEYYWSIAVEDTGIGMDAKILTKIFDPFFTTKAEGQGTGLGLAMVYNIIKQHKGFIDVYSQESIGTTFHIYLPAMTTQDIPYKKPAEEEVSKGEGLILVIDDEEIIRQTAKSILEECGYKTIMATNGEEGIEIYKEHKDEIKAVLLDMVMPKMSGKQAFTEIYNINPDVKVILASGFKQDARVDAILQLGVKEFIQKPYSLNKLASTLDRVLSQ